MEKIYNKLVRDRIPEIIGKDGNTAIMHKLSGVEYLAALEAKLDEEAGEYHRDKSAEELADILEVVYALAEAGGTTAEALERMRLEKREKRGAFEDMIFLEKVIIP